MEYLTKIIDVGDWTMTVRIERPALEQHWQLAVLAIRSGRKRHPDWHDQQCRHLTPDAAFLAARDWAERHLP